MPTRKSERQARQATKRLAGGECAFESMNDSAYRELVVDGAQEEVTVRFRRRVRGSAC
jgi:hypothetical protein